MKFTEKEKATIANALRHARKLYRDDASNARRQAGNCDPGKARDSWERVAKNFDSQQEQCETILETHFQDQL